MNNEANWVSVEIVRNWKYLFFIQFICVFARSLNEIKYSEEVKEKPFLSEEKKLRGLPKARKSLFFLILIKNFLSLEKSLLW